MDIGAIRAANGFSRKNAGRIVTSAESIEVDEQVWKSIPEKYQSADAGEWASLRFATIRAEDIGLTYE